MFGFEKIFDINGNGELNILERGLEFMVIDEILRDEKEDEYSDYEDDDGLEDVDEDY